jgi:hypothetical protein
VDLLESKTYQDREVEVDKEIETWNLQRDLVFIRFIYLSSLPIVIGVIATLVVIRLYSWLNGFWRTLKSRLYMYMYIQC